MTISDLALHLALVVLLPPLLLGVIQKTKAAYAGRRGAPLLQPYRDLRKLFRKGAVYSSTTTWVFRAGPMVALGSALTAGLLLPLHASRAPLGFTGDVVLFAYLLGLGRFFTMLGALDTGSSFEGMGASREAAFSALAEPALFLVLGNLCIPSGGVSFADAWRPVPLGSWLGAHPELVAAALALFGVLLAENSRIPVDDPNTHLELTMVHEVMVLDHGGPDLGFVVYGAAVKLMLFASLLIHTLPIRPGGGWVGAGVFVVATVGVGVLVGLVESVMARLRLVRVPQFLIGASLLGAVGLLVALFGGGR